MLMVVPAIAAALAALGKGAAVAAPAAATTAAAAVGGSGGGGAGGMNAVLQLLSKLGLSAGVRGKGFSGGVDFARGRDRKGIENLLAQLGGGTQPSAPGPAPGLPIRTLGGAGQGAVPTFADLLRQQMPQRGSIRPNLSMR